MADKEETEWSSRELEISKVNFPLTLKFEAGVDLSEGSIINRNTILTIHGKGSIEKAFGHDRLDRSFTIPIECKRKLAVKSLNTTRMFPTVRDICKLRFIPHFITNELQFEIYTVSFPKNTIFEVLLVCIDPENAVLGLSVESFAPHPARMLLPYDIQGNFKEYVLPKDENRSYHIYELKARKLPLFLEFEKSSETDSIAHFEPEGICRIEEIRKCNVVYATTSIDKVQHVLAIECANICTVRMRQVFKGNEYYHRTTEQKVEQTELEKFDWFFSRICSQGTTSFAPRAQIGALWDQRFARDKSCDVYEPMTSFNIYSPSPLSHNGSSKGNKMQSKTVSVVEPQVSQEIIPHLSPMQVGTNGKAPPLPPQRISSLKQHSKQSCEGQVTSSCNNRHGSAPMLSASVANSQVEIDFGHHNENCESTKTITSSFSVEKVLNEAKVVAENMDKEIETVTEEGIDKKIIGDCWTKEVIAKESKESLGRTRSIESDKCVKDVRIVKHEDRADYAEGPTYCSEEPETQTQNLESKHDPSSVHDSNVSYILTTKEDDVKKRVRPVPAKRKKSTKSASGNIEDMYTIGRKDQKRPLPPIRQTSRKDRVSDKEFIEGIGNMAKKMEKHETVAQSAGCTEGGLQFKDSEHDSRISKEKHENLHNLKQLTNEKREETIAGDGSCTTDVFNDVIIHKSSLTSFLSKLHLEKYKEKLSSEQVDIILLKELVESDLVHDIGMTKFDARKVLLNAKHGWWYKESHNEGSVVSSENWSSSDVVNKIGGEIKMPEFAEFCAINEVDGKLLVNILDKELIQSLRDEYGLKISRIEEVKLGQFVLTGWRP